MKIRCAFVHLMGNATVELFLTCSEGGVWSMHVSEASEAGAFPWEPAL